MNTEQVIYEMLTTNTGAHILDSGGAYGRNWERNASKSLDDFKVEPEAWLNNWGELTISVFHHLNNCLDYASDMDKQYLAFTQGSDVSHLEDLENFIEHIGAQAGYGDNSDNLESALSQVIQYQFFTYDSTRYVALQIHQGCDIRGGYTRPYIFEADESLLLGEYGSAFCTGEESHRFDWSGGEWTYEGEYRQAFSPYEMKENARKVGITEYIPCQQCGMPLEGTDMREKVNA